MLEVVGLSSWLWVLFKLNDRYFLSVCCGSVGIFTIEVELESFEVVRYESEGVQFIDELSAKVRGNPTQYGSAEARALLRSPEAEVAVAAWHDAQSSNPGAA